MEKTNENKMVENINEQTTVNATVENEAVAEVKKESAKENANEVAVEKKTEAAPQKDEKKNKKMKGILIGVVSGALALTIALVSIIAIVISATRVKLDDYVTGECQFSGANGYGYVNAESIIDYTALDEEIMEETNNEDIYSWFYGGSYTSSDDYIDITYPENNGTLSNGDVVEITVTINKEGMKNDSSFKKTISGDEVQVFTYTVTGLPDATAIDVFDAVDNVVYDTITDNVSIEFKDEYVKEYGNGVSVKADSGYVKIFINGTWYYTVSLTINTENFSIDNPKVTLYTQESGDQFIENNIVLIDTEKAVDANVVSYFYSMNISDNDIKALKKSADEFMKENFGSGKAKYKKAIAYYDASEDGNFVGLLNFYYEVDGKIYAAIYENLKKDQNNNVYNIEQVEVKTFRTWLWNEIIGEEKIEDFETKHMTYVDKENVKIPS
jgi:hypothetical protein